MAVPSKREIAQFWARSKQRDEFAPHLYGLDHPCCFACGWFSEHWDKPTPRARWQRATLDRAHIVPRSLGGADTVDNLLLLCRPCHQESPDWSEPREMARWIAKRPERPSKEWETLEAWFAAAAKVPEFQDALATIAGEPGAQQRAMDVLRDLLGQAGVHFGVGISPGTRVAVLRGAAERLRDGDTAAIPADGAP
ncbi:hypothetical protein GCM10018785_68420 [Streptomyces longispororuber]|uniref:HNH nuclease domain-containing protein n=1 Tax=Streptomyces longispororuber TaxID=68230 RepID=A0A919DZ03_9ACTN|nr:HNH endonuclease [Streptomyces longispororuber]GHE92550.1 hypothetical protein GCM10018785_68420 [Streptomyces longispororuber]